MRVKDANKRDTGFIGKYWVSRVDRRAMGDCLVLEFEDPIARGAIAKWAEDMRENGYEKVYSDVMKKLDKITVEDDVNECRR
jgi:hypothetical protein